MTRSDITSSKFGDAIEFPDGTQAIIRGLNSQDEMVTLEIPKTKSSTTDSAMPIPPTRPNDPPVEVMPTTVLVPSGPQKTTVIFSWRELAAAARAS
jgi:hypothetical protein